MLAKVTEEGVYRPNQYAALDENGLHISVYALGGKKLWKNILYRFEGVYVGVRRIEETAKSTRTTLGRHEKEAFERNLAAKFCVEHWDGDPWPVVVQDVAGYNEVSMYFRIGDQTDSRVELIDASDTSLPRLILFKNAAWLFNCLWPKEAREREGLIYFVYGATSHNLKLEGDSFTFEGQVFRQGAAQMGNTAQQPAPGYAPQPLTETVPDFQRKSVRAPAPASANPIESNFAKRFRSPSPELCSKARRRSSLYLASSKQTYAAPAPLNREPAIPESSAISASLRSRKFMESLMESPPRSQKSGSEESDSEPAESKLEAKPQLKPKLHKKRGRRRSRRLSFPGEPDPCIETEGL